MSRLRAVLAILAAAAMAAPPALPAQASRTPASAAARTPRDAPPPLIDRELFFGNPDIAAARLSPDGRFVAFLKPYHGTLNVWVKGTGEAFERAHPVTADTVRPVRGFFWTRDARSILFVQDRGGDENFNLYAVDPAAAPEAGRDVPAARDLTHLTGVAVQVVDVPKFDPDVVFIGLNDRDKAWHDLYRLRISTGERTLVRKNTDRVAGWVFDEQGGLRLALRTTDRGDTEILRVDSTAMTPVYQVSVFESAAPLRYHEDGKRVYLETNKGDADLMRLVLFDPATRAETPVETDPKGRVDLGRVMFSDRSGKLIGTVYEDERTRVYWRDSSFARDYRFLQRRFPDRNLGFASGTADERTWLVTASSDVEPGETWLFDRQTRKLTFQYRIWPALPRAHLAPMQAITYRSSDGLAIPAFLTLPKGMPAKGLPLVVFPHGGPWARDSWGYHPFAQFLANRGYAVLMPNFRGSTGYGKRFLNAGNRQWGEKMQDDITWGVKHLVAQGIADPARVGIMGGSYGGYATLAGVAFTPDVYAAAVAIVAPSNLITLLETIPPYWEPIRVMFHERMGNPTTPEGKAQLERQSPLNAVARIHTPLMVVQGANDPRVNKREADQIVVALRDRNFPVEYLVAPDEGHGFARPVNNMAMMMAAERFLAKYLHGRWQEGGTPAVTQRLAELTVPPANVVLAGTLTAAAAPVPARDLEPLSLAYTGAIVAGAQTMKMTSALTVAAHPDGGWAVTERAVLPSGAANDSTRLAARTLVTLARTVQQGPAQVSLSFAGDRAVGSFTMAGTARPIDVALGGPLYADGAGAALAIARLPLAEGYRATIRNFDVQRAKATLRQIVVARSESVTVPAGTFVAWVVESTDEGGGNKLTIWVDKTRAVPLKMQASPGGATITLELERS